MKPNIVILKDIRNLGLLVFLLCNIFQVSTAAEKQYVKSQERPSLIEIEKNKRQEFVNSFNRALSRKEYTQLSKLVNDSPHIAYEIIQLLINDGLASILKGNRKDDYFDWALAIAKEFKDRKTRKSLIDEIYKYKSYTLSEVQTGHEALGLHNKGYSYQKRFDYHKGFKAYEGAIRLLKTIGDERGLARTYLNIGSAYNHINNYAAAEEYLNTALGLYANLCDLKGKAMAVGELGRTFRHLGKYSQCIANHNEAIDIFTQIDDQRALLVELINIANAYKELGKYDKALMIYMAGIENTKKYKEFQEYRAAQFMGNIGHLYALMGDNKNAAKYQKDATKIFRNSNHIHGLITQLNLNATVAMQSGQYYRAIKDLREVLAKVEKYPAQGIRALTLESIGTLHMEMGNYKESLLHLLLAEKAADSTKDPIIKSQILTKIALLYVKLNDLESSLDYLKKTEEIMARVDRPNPFAILRTIIETSLDVGNIDGAISILEKQREDKGTLLELESIFLGTLYSHAGRHDDAINIFSKVVLPPTKSLTSLLHQEMGFAYWNKGELTEALAHYEKAIGLVEGQYDSSLGIREEARASIFKNNRDLYGDYIGLLLDLHQKYHNQEYVDKVFAAMQLAKSRVFQGLMSKKSAMTIFSGNLEFSEKVALENQLRLRLSSLNSLLIDTMRKKDKADTKELFNSIFFEINKVEQALLQCEKEIEVNYPKYAQSRNPKVLSIYDIQKSLRPDEILMAYAVTEKKIACYVISKEDAVLKVLDADLKELARLIKELHIGLDRFKTPNEEYVKIERFEDLQQFNPEISHSIYNKIFKPLREYISERKKIIISPDSVLYTLPFELLIDKTVSQQAVLERRTYNSKGQLSEYDNLHYLIDTYTISYVPSVSILYELRKTHRTKSAWKKNLIAFADPIFNDDIDNENENQTIEGNESHEQADLTIKMMLRNSGVDGLVRLADSVDEAIAVAAQVNGNEKDIYLRENATEQNIYQIPLQEARYILFSTHGLLGGEYDGVIEPSLALTLVNNPPEFDGFLSMSEILALTLTADLVVLSACNTYGHGNKAGEGEGFAGLARSFMYAGAHSLLITHWSVDSQTTKDVVINTFQNIATSGGAEALRTAKLKIKSSSRSINHQQGESISLSHPFFWAPYVMVGVHD